MDKYNIEVTLLDDEIKFLRHLANYPEKDPQPVTSTGLTEKEARQVMAFGFVDTVSKTDRATGFPVSTGLCFITRIGRRYLKRLDEKLKEKFDAKIDKYITRGLSVIAIIISIVALLKPTNESNNRNYDCYYSEPKIYISYQP